MRIEVAGRDRTEDLGERLRRAAAGRPAAIRDEAERQADVVAIRSAADEAENLEQWLAMLRAHHGIRTEPFDVPVRPGPAGAVAGRVRRFLWKLLRYQHDRTAFQQSAVNIQVVLALEAVARSLGREVRELRARLDEFERRPGAGQGGEGGAP